ncbi:hypothetical protein ACEUZ9_005433 [Paracoccus litorisediminis]|uniref:Uncharacterized protein n=1 Tax=Paracoccus litorisediminis TaxID=2006130 RepID=A0A844HU79_9RHOB|nr:hypothetical protein [Paracoccus litorisediminis]MTH61072.1 hypothetical protein [Paracoccus litorisediminis]
MQQVYGHKAISYLDRDRIRAEVEAVDYNCGSLDVHSDHLHPVHYALASRGWRRMRGPARSSCRALSGSTRRVHPRVCTDQAEVEANHQVLGGGESYDYRFPSAPCAKDRCTMRRVFSELTNMPLSHILGGALGITMSRIPHFSRLGPATLWGSGFSGQGAPEGQMDAAAV